LRPSATGVETERENRTKTIAVHGEALAVRELAQASDAMMARPLALWLRNLQTRLRVVGFWIAQNASTRVVVAEPRRVKPHLDRVGMSRVITAAGRLAQPRDRRQHKAGA
jgi:hypothetical protein